MYSSVKATNCVCVCVGVRLTEFESLELRQMGRSAELIKDMIIPLLVGLEESSRDYRAVGGDLWQARFTHIHHMHRISPRTLS